ncbi:MAG: pentapeptide repeat-containing protein [Gammaproteobacteria bacterium]|nr:pentapeptide repeat-containing protein [Gammaproteobacteria bacterium]
MSSMEATAEVDLKPQPNAGVMTGSREAIQKNLVIIREQGRVPREMDTSILRGAHLIGEDLSGLDLSGLDLSGADLSRANLSNSKLVNARLAGAVLYEADLTGCELLSADLTEANLGSCSAAGAGFESANLTNATMFSAQLKGATFTKAVLRGADMRRANLQDTRIREADISDVDLTRCKMQSADLEGSCVDKATLMDADLCHSRLRGLKGYASANWIGADVHGVNFTGAYLTRRTIMDQNYLHEFRTQSRANAVIYWIWWVTSDCGRSFLRWGACIFLLLGLFAVLFNFVAIDYGQYPTALSSLYYSVVTLTTLGYGDVLPTSIAAQVLAMIEVVIGYVMLGGLLSIFANKMARRAD